MQIVWRTGTVMNDDDSVVPRTFCFDDEADCIIFFLPPGSLQPYTYYAKIVYSNIKVVKN